MKNLIAVIESAQSGLNARAVYAANCLSGRQRWSGADLKGKVKRFGGSYHMQRGIAMRALKAAGGALVSVEHGLIVTGVYVGADDFGAAVYHTTAGVAVAARKWCRVVRDSNR